MIDVYSLLIIGKPIEKSELLLKYREIAKQDVTNTMWVSPNKEQVIITFANETVSITEENIVVIRKNGKMDIYMQGAITISTMTNGKADMQSIVINSEKWSTDSIGMFEVKSRSNIIKNNRRL